MALPKVKPVPEVVLLKALRNAQQALQFSGSKVARIIGVSPSTFSRIKTLEPEKKSGELAVLLIRVYRSLFALFGGNHAQMRQWLHTHNHALAGVPEDLLGSVAGLVAVNQYLDAMRGVA